MSILKFFNILLLLILDFAVLIFCGIYLMGYDDFYEQRQGEYFGFSSMKMEYKIVWGFYNFWILANCLFLFFIIYKGYKKWALK